MLAPSPHDAQRVAAVRRFNRFYTQKLGVLQPDWLDSPFSLTEARVLYEIKQRERTTATDIAGELDLDAGYLSRILRAVSQQQADPQACLARGRPAKLSLDHRARPQGFRAA